MPKFDLTAPDGTEWEVEAPDQQSAVKALQEQRQQTANKALVNEANTAPEWAKPLMAMRDVATVGADTLTGGFGTKAVKSIFGGEPEMDVEARRNRMGWSAPALDAALMARLLPTAVPKIMGFMGGGPAARAIVGTGTAAAEGGLVGGVQAAGHDQDVATGTGLGAAGGVVGQQVGGILNKANKLIRGVDDSVPQGIRSKITVLPKNPSAADKVTVADNVAKSLAKRSDDPLAAQTEVKNAIESILRKDKKSFTPEQRTLMSRVVDEDPATKLSRIGGGYLSDKWTAGGVGAAAGFGSGSPILGALTSGAVMGTGRALKGVSAGGTKEAMDDLLRAMRGRDKYEGILSRKNSGRVAKGTRQLFLEDYPEYDPEGY